jgi:hypothetical protein
MISCYDYLVQRVDWLCIYDSWIDVRYNANKEVKLVIMHFVKIWYRGLINKVFLQAT